MNGSEMMEFSSGKEGDKTSSAWRHKEEEKSERNTGKWTVTVDNPWKTLLLKENTNDLE